VAIATSRYTGKQVWISQCKCQELDTQRQNNASSASEHSAVQNGICVDGDGGVVPSKVIDKKSGAPRGLVS
jgi:hypothetical protein